MLSRVRQLKFYLFLLLIILGVIFYKSFFIKKHVYSGNFSNDKKNITLVDEENNYRMNNVKSETVKEFLEEKKVSLNEKDFIFPQLDAKIYDNARVIIERNKEVSIAVDGKNVKGETFGSSVAMAIWDNGIKLGEDDFTIPSFDAPLKNNSKIEVIRVDIREDIVKKEVDFEKQMAEDDKLGWRIKKVSQKGVKGVDEYKYKVVSHNGKEISRKLLSRERTKDPTPEISVQGTYMKLGKANKGQGTWYAFKGGLFAASTTLPRGAYAKVTNSANGKTVVVQINDYGPQGKGRVIDLDKVAFEKIADLGAGVIGVKVEQVLN
jgi:uncharacterized protein YabE (DUF348 family)